MVESKKLIKSLQIYNLHILFPGQFVWSNKTHKKDAAREMDTYKAKLLLEAMFFIIIFTYLK